MSVPALAPLVTLLVLAELAAGTMAIAFIADCLGEAGRGYLGSTSAICALLMALDLVVAAVLPDPAQLLHQSVDEGAYASTVHWAVGLTVALVLYTFMCAVGTDPARRVVGAVGVLCGGVMLWHAAASFGGSTGGTLTAFAAFVPAALLAGSALAGMLLGHWYLIAPELSFRPLRQATYLVFAAIGVQALAIAVAVAVAPAATRDALLGARYGAAFWLLVVAAGLVFTGAVNALTLYFARIRANQPATAMLYALIISAMLGVVPAHLLLFLTGVAV